MVLTIESIDVVSLGAVVFGGYGRILRVRAGCRLCCLE
jgi:hypothetical protein